MQLDIELTCVEIAEIVDHTIQKIERYPKHLGKTVENYFDLFFTDEVKNYLRRSELNLCSAILLNNAKG